MPNLHKILSALMLGAALSTTALADADDEKLAVSMENVDYLKTRLDRSGTIITGDTLAYNAWLSEQLWAACLSDVYNSTAVYFGELSGERLEQVAAMTCQYPEDIVQLYNILLAADHIGQPMSEMAAFERLQQAYQTHGQDSQLRAKMIQALKERGLITTKPVATSDDAANPKQ